MPLNSNKLKDFPFSIQIGKYSINLNSQKIEEIIMPDTFSDRDFYKHRVEDAINKHLNSNKLKDFPFSIQIGEYSINLNSLSMSVLNEIFEKYKDKLYDSYKFDLDFNSNPNIIKNEKNINDIETKQCNLNTLLINTTLNILADFKHIEKDAFVVYNPKYLKPNSPIVDFELLTINSKSTDNIRTNNDYLILNQFPLRKSLSLDANYFSIINSLNNCKNILNPEYKYNYNPKFDVFTKKPTKEWKLFESIYAKKDTTQNNKIKTKNITSSLTRNKEISL